jgi:hypothetical protein
VMGSKLLLEGGRGVVTHVWNVARSSIFTARCQGLISYVRIWPGHTAGICFEAIPEMEKPGTSGPPNTTNCGRLFARGLALLALGLAFESREHVQDFHDIRAERLRWAGFGGSVVLVHGASLKDSISALNLKTLNS